MKKIIILLLLGFSSISCATADNLLFFQSSADAVITKTAKNTYTLTLHNAGDYVSYFTDRPSRKVGLITLSQFLSLWTDAKIKDNFTQNPPNVALNIVSAQGKEQNVVVEVSKPSYANKNVSYQIRTIDDKPLTAGQLKHLVLFFDDIHWNPGGF